MFYFSLLLKSEIQNGYLMRSMIAGVTIFEIVLSFVIIQVIFSIIQAFSLFFLADFLLYISWESSLLLIIQLNIAIGICGMSIGLLIGSFTNSSIQSFYITLLVCLVNIMLSGIFWPIKNTELALLPISIILPLSMPIQAVKAILIQGHKFDSNDILLAGMFELPNSIL
ncbi:ABC transporter G family member 20-like [Melanaphis sacchari]|uniref:ABC transporter G family member 20-like n=1 Tax=Melanaphis sacchari TaxID=742174 RepID=UPI000DC131A2|nr:ABC transporter G family member 20-like [Melanaphis sacchari]